MCRDIFQQAAEIQTSTDNKNKNKPTFLCPRQNIIKSSILKTVTAQKKGPNPNFVRTPNISALVDRENTYMYVCFINENIHRNQGNVMEVCTLCTQVED